LEIWDRRRRRLRRKSKTMEEEEDEKAKATRKEGFMQDKFGSLGWEEAEVEEEQQDDGRGRREDG